MLRLRAAGPVAVAFLAAMLVLLMTAEVAVAADEQPSAQPAHSVDAAAGHEGGEAEGDGGHEEEENIFSGSFGNAIWTLVIFIVLLIVLRATAWKPILKSLQDREQTIRSAIDEARQGSK